MSQVPDNPASGTQTLKFLVRRNLFHLQLKTQCVNDVTLIRNCVIRTGNKDLKFVA